MPTLQASGSALPSALAEGTPFGFRKGTHLEDLPVPAAPFPVPARTYIASSAPSPDERFTAYRLNLDRVNKLCKVVGVRTIPSSGEGEEVQQFFRDMHDELATLFGREGEAEDPLDQPFSAPGFTRLQSSWWRDDGTADWPSSTVVGVGVTVVDLGKDGSWVEVIFELGCE